MADVRTVYAVGLDDETRRKAWEFAQQKQIQFETYSHGKSFLANFDRRPGCLVADLQIEDMSGLELQQQLAQLGIKLPVIFVTADAEADLIVTVMQNGATTVLLKPIGEREIRDAVTIALARDGEIRRVDERHEELKRRLKDLSPRDMDVLALIMDGLPNKVIANRLGISLRTVEGRRQSIFLKTKCGSLAELIRLVIHANLESPDE